jgi:vacuolar-type H+-ATPase subunit E/Vma4
MEEAEEEAAEAEEEAAEAEEEAAEEGTTSLRGITWIKGLHGLRRSR